jgi:two-component sensor histidine kinase
MTVVTDLSESIIPPAPPFAADVASLRLALAETALAEERRRADALSRVMVAAQGHDVQAVVQAVVDAAVDLTGARFGAFFHNSPDLNGDFGLYTLSGAAREAFAAFPPVTATPLFAPTFNNEGVVRCDDVLADPRFGKNRYGGMPPGHLPVRSYLAAPVVTASGEVLGGLLFGHPEVKRFSARTESLLLGLGAQAAGAIELARLHAALRDELEERRVADRRQKLLLHELNHRVKNTLATVQSIAYQTSRFTGEPRQFRAAFEARLAALSKTHDLLTAQRWEGADLREVAELELAPFALGSDRVTIEGPAVPLSPNAVVTLGLALHELVTNALKYGALSTADGKIRLDWRSHGGRLSLVWSEHDGPPVSPPLSRGFGSRLLEQGIKGEMAANVRLDYDPAGLRCYMDMPLSVLEA